MTIDSMTGFAREAGTGGLHSWAWEIRSVNGRGLDIRVRVPPGFDSISDAARKALTAAFTRGTLHVNLTIASDATQPRPRVNEAALAAVIESLGRVSLPDGIAPLSLDGLLAVRGVVEVGDDGGDLLAELSPAILAGLERVVAALKLARRSEGRALEEVIGRQLETIAALAEDAERHPARSTEAIRARLAEQVAALVEASATLDQQRLYQEAALLAVKSDIREEIDRLKAHVEALRVLLAQGGAIGRKLDFLAQEFGREASTLCAKAVDPGLSRIGLELRTVVDQMREQVQNVE